MKFRLKVRSVKDVLNLLWFIDASHCVHWDSRGHGGAALFMGEGAMSSYSNRLKLNTRSSTESEIVAVDRYMPEVLWTMYFLQEQGFPVKISKVAQDNQTAQLLETKGKFSSTARTKHVKNKFFFVKDKVDQGEIAIVDCPTEKMWGDFFSKPLQGRLFKRMRAVIMNCEEEYVDLLDPSPKSREQVPGDKDECRENLKPPELSREVQVRQNDAPSALRPPKDRARTACPSSQECVGRHLSERPASQRVRFKTPLADSQLANRPRGGADLAKGGRLWSDVVAGRKPPRGKDRGQSSGGPPWPH